MSVPLKRKLVVIEDGTLTSMALNGNFVREFPFLASIGQQLKGKTGKRKCGSCAKAAKERAVVFTSAKAVIAGLPQAKKRQLREMLNAEQLRITYKNNSGKMIRLTF
jgi:hypothetical protein